MTTTTDLLRVPGATLYYEMRGTGPMLLISQSGEGDAGRSIDLVDQLVGDFTMVTYDRRGLSRSTLDDPARGVTFAKHAQDVHHLLAALRRPLLPPRSMSLMTDRSSTGRGSDGLLERRLVPAS